MTYTKQQKKQMRKNAYDMVSDIYKLVKKEITQIDEGSDLTYFIKTLAFLKALKTGNYKLARYFHKNQTEAEEHLIDIVVFSKLNTITSEQTRRVCQMCKEYSKMRKDLLLKCMKVDASVGYWKLSK